VRTLHAHMLNALHYASAHGVRARVCRSLLLAAVLVAGLAGALAGTASAASAAAAAPSAPASSRPEVVAPTTGVMLTAAQATASPQACVDYAYAAIEGHTIATATSAACKGLTRTQVNQAAGTAIRMTLTGGSKPVRRQEAVAAAVWVRALITGPPPAPASPPAVTSNSKPAAIGSQSIELGLGNISELAAQVSALLAWLATAASGGWILIRWLRAGGNPLRRTPTSAPPAVILGHVGGGLVGLVLWAAFMLSGWAALAWIALGLLAPVAGAGMGVLALGLPRPGRPRPSARRPRIPVFAIFGHGLFATVALLLVLMATIGA
jgi:hypothetical protein